MPLMYNEVFVPYKEVEGSDILNAVCSLCKTSVRYDYDYGDVDGWIAHSLQDCFEVLYARTNL